MLLHFECHCMIVHRNPFASLAFLAFKLGSFIANGTTYHCHLIYLGILIQAHVDTLCILSVRDQEYKYLD